jgi:hypothetical protein
MLAKVADLMRHTSIARRFPIRISTLNDRPRYVAVMAAARLDVRIEVDDMQTRPSFSI